MVFKCIYKFSQGFSNIWIHFDLNCSLCDYVFIKYHLLKSNINCVKKKKPT
jgi:hypothetical protein